MKKMISMSLSLLFVLSIGSATISISASASAASYSTANSIVSTGEHYLGTPYHYGSQTGKTHGFDCSSFVQYVYQKNGITLPRSSRQQSHVGKYISKKDLKPGDLVFFYSPIHHVAIYIGNGKIIHTYGRPGVTISNLNSGWWQSHYSTARRVLG